MYYIVKTCISLTTCKTVHFNTPWSRCTSLLYFSQQTKEENYAFCRVPLQESEVAGGNGECISLFQIYQLHERWCRDDLSPADWQHTVHFPGTTRANCSIASPLGVLAELQTLSVFAFKHVQNLPQNFK